MALKNTYTTVPGSRSIDSVERMLMNFGASQILKDYGNIPEIGVVTTKIAFILKFEEKSIPIVLPARIEAVKIYLNKQMTPSGRPLSPALKSWKQAYNTAWKNINDWIYAQITLIQVEQAEFLEVFLPYIDTGKGISFYEKAKSEMLGLGYKEVEK